MKTDRLAFSILFCAILVVIGQTAWAECLWQPGTRDNWALFKDRFIAPEGRVIDTGNQGVTHSEGQGFALRLSLAYDDRATFERVWDWTRANLYVRGDELAAWRWRPNAEPAIDDPNNATDGDLFIAWSLFLAAERWQDPALRARAQAIAGAIRNTLIRETGLGPVLLPGAVGFEREDGLILNPSYWVFPALQDLARLEPDQPVWGELIQSGLRLLERARFGRWGLPPDWIAFKDDALSLPPDFAPRFGYEAIRVPLYLVWGGLGDERSLKPFLEYWEQTGPMHPAWVDLIADTFAPYPAKSGTRSVLALAAFVAPQASARALRLPDLASEEDYYSAALGLLMEVALRGWCRP